MVTLKRQVKRLNLRGERNFDFLFAKLGGRTSELKPIPIWIDIEV